MGEPAPFAQTELFTENGVDELAVAHVVGLGPFDEQGEVLGQMRQPEASGVGYNPAGDQFARATPTNDSPAV